MNEFEQALRRLRSALAAEQFAQAALRVQRLLAKYNPNWHLQPRVPAGNPEGGQWVAHLMGAAASILPVLQRIGPSAIAKLKEAARRIAPELRRLPKRWFDDGQPSEESYDKETRRISRDSWQRRGLPNVRFRNEDELRRSLGPAGKGREWHHIVEKRLVGRPGFPPEQIHTTDNIISLPVEVHRRISETMSSKTDEFLGQVRRFGMETLDFGTQYDLGLDLIEKTLRDFGYDPSHF